MAKEEVNLKLILVSGSTHEFQFSPSVSASQVCEYVFENWPASWKEEKVASPSLLKLIYHGRFLHGSVTLSALSLPSGKTTVMHLVAREHLPEPNSNGIFEMVEYNRYFKKIQVNPKRDADAAYVNFDIKILFVKYVYQSKSLPRR